MIRFEAVVRISDVYGYESLTDEEIKHILTENLSEDADLKVLEIMSITRVDEKGERK